MALVQRLFLSLLVLLMVLHSRAANYAPQKSQEAADSLADSLAAWRKDGLEPLGELGPYAEADGSQKSAATKHMHNPTETAAETTKEAPNGQDHMESVFCRGKACIVAIVLVVLAVTAGILVCSLTICWCDKKRQLSGDQQERARLITHSDSQTSIPEPAQQ